MEVRTNCLAGVAAVMLALLSVAVVLPVQSALAGKPRTCDRQARGAKIDKRTSMVVVYTRGSRTFGCWRSSRRTIRLYETGQDTAVEDGVLQRVVVNGRFVLVYSQAEGQDYTLDRFRVYDLSRRRLSYMVDPLPATAPLPRSTVGAIALTSTGVVAWGLEHFDNGCRGPSEGVCARMRNVITASAGRERQLDEGGGIDIYSVRIIGAIITWRHGGVVRSSPLT